MISCLYLFADWVHPKFKVKRRIRAHLFKFKLNQLMFQSSLDKSQTFYIEHLHNKEHTDQNHFFTCSIFINIYFTNSTIFNELQKIVKIYRTQRILETIKSFQFRWIPSYDFSLTPGRSLSYSLHICTSFIYFIFFQPIFWRFPII